MLEPQNFMRPSEKAASTLTTMVIATTHTVTITVFLKKIRKSVCVEQQPELIERHPIGDDPWIGRHVRDLGIALERGDDHVIGRNQEKDREHDEKYVRRDQRPAAIALQACADATLRRGAHADGGRAHPISLPRLRTPRRMKIAAIARIGNMNSDVAAPSGRSPERMPSRKA